MHRSVQEKAPPQCALANRAGLLGDPVAGKVASRDDDLHPNETRPFKRPVSQRQDGGGRHPAPTGRRPHPVAPLGSTVRVVDLVQPAATETARHRELIPLRLQQRLPRRSGDTVGFERPIWRLP